MKPTDTTLQRQTARTRNPLTPVVTSPTSRPPILQPSRGELPDNLIPFCSIHRAPSPRQWAKRGSKRVPSSFRSLGAFSIVMISENGVSSVYLGSPSRRHQNKHKTIDSLLSGFIRSISTLTKRFFIVHQPERPRISLLRFKGRCGEVVHVYL